MSFPKNISRTAIDKAARQMIADIFNKAAGDAAQVEQVQCYNPDWDNIGNEGFLRNAEFSAVHCLVSGKFVADDRGHVPGNVTVRYDAGHGPRGVALTYATPGAENGHDARLKEVLDFAKEWLKNHNAPFSQPRLIDMPGLKMRALWLEGPFDVFIPVGEFHTKVGDPIAVDDKYLDRVRAKHAELQEMYKDMDPEAGGGSPRGGSGGGSGGRLRPPGA